MPREGLTGGACLRRRTGLFGGIAETAEKRQFPSVSVKCTSGLETYFRVYGYFCSTSSCSYVPGTLVSLGGTSKVTSGAYYSGKWYVKGCYVTNGC